MKTIDVKTIEETVCSLAKEANFILPSDIVEEIEAMQKREESPLAQSVLGEILQNATLAKDELLPLCQDTGVATIFVTIGQDVHITGGSLEEAIHNGVAKGYTDGYLRKSMVKEPLFERENTKIILQPLFITLLQKAIPCTFYSHRRELVVKTNVL